MRYGIDTPPTAGMSANPVYAWDEKTTDIEKAYFATRGQSVHKIKRPFYEATTEDRVDVSNSARKTSTDLIREPTPAYGY